MTITAAWAHGPIARLSRAARYVMTQLAKQIVRAGKAYGWGLAAMRYPPERAGNLALRRLLRPYGWQVALKARGRPSDISQGSARKWL
ncbi:hypothetical protein [Alteraurantiacibacter aestuarii]|uniref:hypothetical protein n=1 Tax=Alteraurantiacibacter aestuarii TaxID=650004 RepID=UPI0031D239D6